MVARTSLTIIIGVCTALFADKPVEKRTKGKTGMTAHTGLNTQAEPQINWRDARELTVEGLGWSDTAFPYHRFPSRAKETLPEPVWNMGCQPAGVSVRFVTDGTGSSARWRITEKPKLMGSMTMQAAAGLDCYGRLADGGWAWVGSVSPGDQLETTAGFADGLDGTRREYRVYLPACTELPELHIGVKGAKIFEPGRPDTRKPVVYYGTSVVHGVTASRSGMSHASILQRRFDCPLVNLGISGSGRMDKPVADLMAELDAALYIVDCLPNMGQDQVRERLPVLVDVIRKKRPVTPILFVGDRMMGGAAFVPVKVQYKNDQDRVQKETVDSLTAKGVAGLYTTASESFFGADHEGSTDGSHPSDLGAMRMADALEPVIRRLAGIGK